MPVYKHKEKDKQGRQWYYNVNYTDILGKHRSKRSKSFLLKKEAEEAEIRFKTSLGKEVKSSMYISDLCSQYIEWKKDKVKIQTLPKYINVNKYINKYLGNIRIDKLSVEIYENFKRELNNTDLSANYKNKIHSQLKSMLLYSRKYYRVYSDVPEIVGGFKDADKLHIEQDYYTIDEYNLFRDQLDNIIWIAFFDTLYFSGTRLGEANALTWEDINFEKQELKITKTVTTKITGMEYYISSPKTKSSVRTLPMPKIILNDLISLKEYYKNYEGFTEKWFVFGGIRPLADTTITKKKIDAANNADIKQIRIHDFRHSCASLLINNGANITVVSKYLGHSKIDITLNTYSHMYKSKLDEVVTMIDSIKF